MITCSLCKLPGKFHEKESKMANPLTPMDFARAREKLYGQAELSLMVVCV